MDELEEIAQKDKATIINAAGRAVVPGFVDSHTHLVFGGNRADEFAMRTAGMSYEEIAVGGGGIASTVRATREASKADLKAQALKRLNRALRQGTTTMEVKSGYGLDPETEFKMLEVVAELNEEHLLILSRHFGRTLRTARHGEGGIHRTGHFHVAQGIWLAKFCDVFCEQGYFTPEESVRILETAREAA